MKEKKGSGNSNKDIEVTLNGGNHVLDSATVPIRWWLSKKVLNESVPYYVLFVEQNDVEKGNKYHDHILGRRYVCKFSEAIHYLQIFSPGQHRLMVVVVSGETEEEALDIVKGYLNKRNDNYQSSLNWEAAARNQSFGLASTVVEFEVPEELFAKAPKTKFQKLVWDWVNMWHKEDPLDQCSYRRRKIVAFTIQPPVMLLFAFIGFGIFGTIHALYVLLASFTVFFFGYRPQPILRNMWQAFIMKRGNGWDVKEYSRRKVWSEKYVNGQKQVKEMPITPLDLMFWVAVGYTMFSLISQLMLLITESLILSFWIAVSVTVLTAATYVWYRLKRRYSESWKLKQAVKAEAKRQALLEKKKLTAAEEEKALLRRRQWLLQNFALSKRTKTVDPKNIPAPLYLSDRIVQRFYVKYWEVKNKVCRPFAK